ncbi:hypothetical protein IFM89_002985 [Coptis chinensis]|uniref:Uncharacterized protein n=1 Tax=Coptis chinensis TaxID=261450 RepID=A0A835LTS2_9MAGN|nr:hypothetical protein IFM89_002985 [Coptis chinensis]
MKKIDIKFVSCETRGRKTHEDIPPSGEEKTTGMEHYDSALAYPVQSPGMKGNQPDIVMDSLSVHGLGLVHPKKVFDFYDELHAYLSSCGVEGVKVYVQNIIETLGKGHGGRVALTRSYHQALEASISHNFPDNGCIACMCHNTEEMYSAKNSVVSLHPTADYHAAARAVGGCPIYVRPTHDCLFADPARDGTRHPYYSVRATDVDLIDQVVGADWNGEVVVYAHRLGELANLV